MISVGKIVEYLENGKFICGFITEIQAKRVHLFNHNKRELTLPLARIIHCSSESQSIESHRDHIVKVLQETNENRSTLMKEIDLEEIWELTCDEETNSYETAFLAELFFGQKANDDIISAFLRSVFLDKLFFKFKDGKIKANSREQVEMLRQQEEREQQKRDLIQKGVSILLHIKEKKPLSELDPVDLKKSLAYLENYYLFGADFKDFGTAREMLKEAGLMHPHDPYFILVQSGVWSEHENIPLLRNKLPVNFSFSSIQLAETLLQSSIQQLYDDPARKDLTHLSPLTIDGATTLDFDDAITVEESEGNYLIGIHISDVSHYVKPGDPLFQEAMNRGTSIYFPESQIPMLPRHLSQGICSLIENEIRAAFSFMILLSHDADIVKVRIFPSIIKVARRLTYEESDAMIKSDRELSILDSLCKKLRARRLAAGALLLPFPDVNIYIDSQNKVHVSLGATDTPSRILVSELMILANMEAARYVSDRMAPGLFRSQEPPKQHIVHGEDNDLFINTRQRKQLSRGELLTTPKRHSGLGVNQYTTVTSPIRRLLDLVMQHQLHSLVRREEPKFTEEMCKDFTSIITRTIAHANAVKQQRQRYWLLVYLKEREGKFVRALVIESGPKRTMLLLTDILFDVDLPAPSGQKPAPGKIVEIKVVKSDPLDNNVSFSWQ